MRYEEKTYSTYRASYYVLATGRYHHKLFVIEAEHFSTPTLDALFAYLGKCVFSI
jgi:hypothetical protein